jgi:DNA-binding transcriptional regulator PaaX
MKSQTDYQKFIQTIEPGLDRAILHALQFHINRGNAVSRTELVTACKMQGFNAHERQVREEIKQLRRAGQLIGSAPGEDGGYYMITTLAEFEEFKHMEFIAKISDMETTLKAMTRAAKEQFGDGIQISLFQ